MEIKDFFILLNKHLSGKTNLDENKEMLNFYESFQTSDKWEETLGPKEEVQIGILNKIQERLKSEKGKVVSLRPFYTRTAFKVVAAACVVMFISITLLYNFDQPIKGSEKVLTQNISIGSNKAILTLEDGSVVALEKGKDYSAGSVSSNGEKIIYNSKNKLGSIANNFLTIPRGGQFFVQLADSTKVWLNSESQLKYPVAFVDGKTRQVELVYGEAYFEVSPSTKHKGSKFKVKTKSQNIEVIGTEFNIKAYNDEATVYTTLVKGKVAVSNGKVKEFLTPNKQSKVSATHSNIEVSEVDVFKDISWTKGLFVFKGMPLKEISRVLSRWYDVDITFVNPELGNVKFNGVLSKNQKIEDILTTMKNINCINSFEINNHKIIMK